MAASHTPSPSIVVSECPYGGWERCLAVSNGCVDLVVTLDVGPRIIHAAPVGGANMMKQYPEMLGKTGAPEWRIYGGHRLWHAPEEKPRTYPADNFPVRHERVGRDGVKVAPPVETHCGIQKELVITPAEALPVVTVEHRITNVGAWPINLAPWALTVMAPGGRAIMPLPPKGAHAANLTPNGRLALWAYTDLSDPRFIWGPNSVVVRQDPKAKNQQKIGVYAPQGWIAYHLGDQLFIKTAPVDPGARYPDEGVNLEVYTDSEMLEIETLGALTELAPGETVTHTETWRIERGIPGDLPPSELLERVAGFVG